MTSLKLFTFSLLSFISAIGGSVSPGGNREPYMETVVKDLQLEIAGLKNEMENLRNSLREVKNTVNDISDTPLPIGYVYVQLPDQKSPSEIWPEMQWEDVSSNYAGVFFRVYGGDSSSFGSVQEENSPRITEMIATGEMYNRSQSNISPRDEWSIKIQADGNRSNDLYLGLWVGDTKYTAESIQVVESGGEIRPRNMAVKIWRRYR